MMRSVSRPVRRGFTLMELIIALVIGGALIAAAFALAQASNQQVRQIRAQGQIATQGLEVDGTLLGDIRQAGRDLASFPNLGAVNILLDSIGTGQALGTPIRDQLLLLTAEPTLPRPLRVLTAACSTPAPNCVRIASDDPPGLALALETLRDSVFIMLGSPQLGGQLARIAGAVADGASLPCGVQCRTPLMTEWETARDVDNPALTASEQCINPLTGTLGSCSAAEGGVISGIRSGLWRGTTVSGGVACTQSTQRVSADATGCGAPQLVARFSASDPRVATDPLWEMAPTTSSVAVVPVSAAQSANQARNPGSETQLTSVEVTFDVATAVLGYPQSPLTVLRSGPGDQPSVLMQVVRPLRYRVETDPAFLPEPTLVRESGWSWTAEGFTQRAPVVRNIEAFRVEHLVGPTVQPVRSPVATATNDAAVVSQYVRRPIATDGMLAFTRFGAGAPTATSCAGAQAADTVAGPQNRVSSTSVADTLSTVAGWQYCRSYQTVAGIRIRYDIVSVSEDPATRRVIRQQRTYTTTVATPNLRAGATLLAF